jgi:hypothetical protein
MDGEMAYEKYAGSIRFWVLILASVYFGYAVYYAVYGLQFTLQLTHDHYVYGLVTKNPWWWIILYYGSEGVAGAVSIVPSFGRGAHKRQSDLDIKKYGASTNLCGYK